MTKVILTGSTGMVGSAVLRALVAEPRVTEITSISRRANGVQHAKLTEMTKIGFEDAAALAPHFAGASAIFHCLSTYSNKVDKDTYDHVTLTYLQSVLDAAANACPEATFALHGASGASQEGRSWTRALNIKGQAELLLLDSPLPRKLIFRPGYIAPTHPEHQKGLMDLIGRPLFRLFPTSGTTDTGLGRAMVTAVLDCSDAEMTFENRDIRALVTE